MVAASPSSPPREKERERKEGDRDRERGRGGLSLERRHSHVPVFSAVGQMGGLAGHPSNATRKVRAASTRLSVAVARAPGEG